MSELGEVPPPVHSAPHPHAQPGAGTPQIAILHQVRPLSQSPSPNTFATMQSSSSAPSFTPGMDRGGVHVVWDLHSTPFPPGLNPLLVVKALINFADTHGFIKSFKAVCPAESRFPLPCRAALADQSVEVEEVATPKINVAILTHLLRISIGETEQQCHTRVGHHSRSSPPSLPTTLLLLTACEDVAPAVSVLRASRRFTDVVLVYSSHACPPRIGEPISLTRHATTSIEWHNLLHHSLTTLPAAALTPPLEAGGQALQQRMGVGPGVQMGAPPILGDVSAMSSVTSSAASSPMLVPVPPSAPAVPGGGAPMHVRSMGASQPSSRNSSISSVASLGVSTSIVPTPSNPNQTTAATAAAAAAAAASGRSQMGALLDVTPLDDNSTSINDLSIELQLERLHPRMRALVMALKSVLQYCENERIIPR
jgi:hypothetical protein